MQNNKNSILIKAIGITSVVLIVLICGLYLYKTYMPRYNTYIKVGNHKISECEYQYYYNSYMKFYLENFSPYFDYMGVNPDEDLMAQEYDNGMTFEEMFKQCAVDQIKEIYSLYDEAKANNFEYDTTEVYDGYIATVESMLSNNNTLDDYFKLQYGQYITPNLIKKYINLGYYSMAYYNKLKEDMGDEEAYNYVQDLKSKMEVVYY